MPFGFDLKAVVLQHITERNASDLAGKFRDFHLFIAIPKAISYARV